MLGAGSAVDTKIRVLESFLTLNLSLITNSISEEPNVDCSSVQTYTARRNSYDVKGLSTLNMKA